MDNQQAVYEIAERTISCEHRMYTFHMRFHLYYLEFIKLYDRTFYQRVFVYGSCAF
jgi:hypothetical protein